jgi:hypothetical protein
MDRGKFENAKRPEGETVIAILFRDLAQLQRPVSPTT